MKNKENISGREFGKWTVLYKTTDKNQRSCYKCRCRCGTEHDVLRQSLVENSSTQCKNCRDKENGLKKLNDLTNQTFGKWFVIKHIPSIKNETMFLCKCECGKIKKVKSNSLISGVSTKCGRCSAYKDITATVWNSILHNAKKREIFCDLQIESLWILWEKQQHKCALTGTELSFKHKCENKASLDRIDSSGGYTINNVQWIHKDVNKLKTDFEQSKFIQICKMIVNYTQIKNNKIYD